MPRPVTCLLKSPQHDRSAGAYSVGRALQAGAPGRAPRRAPGRAAGLALGRSAAPPRPALFPARRDKALGAHTLHLTRTLYIERDDFREVDGACGSTVVHKEVAPLLHGSLRLIIPVATPRNLSHLTADPDYFGLAPGKAAGLRYAGMVTVEGVERGDDDSVSGRPSLQWRPRPSAENGFFTRTHTCACAPHVARPCVHSCPCAMSTRPSQVTGLLASYDGTRGGGRARVKGNLHWVSGSAPGVPPATAEVRLYDYLFTVDEPGAGGADWEAEINPASEVVLTVRGCAAAGRSRGSRPTTRPLRYHLR